jgi:hypothetical protein
VTLVINKKVREFFTFDKKNQCLKLNVPSDHELNVYKDKNGNLDAVMFFNNFLTNVRDIVKNISEEIQELNILNMTVDYTPCKGEYSELF